MQQELFETTSVYLMDAGPVNVMLDFETWGTEPGSALRSIGAVMFDPHGAGMGAEFYANIEDHPKLTKSQSTIDWWAKQPRDVQDLLEKDKQPLDKVVADFHAWWRKQRAIFVWGQGASFDPVLWEAACRVLGASAPWKFWDIRCTRTAYDMGGFDPRSVKNTGRAHYALDDAKHQVVCVQRAYAKVWEKQS